MGSSAKKSARGGEEMSYEDAYNNPYSLLDYEISCKDAEIKRLDSEIERLETDLSMFQEYEREWMQVARERGRLITELANAMEKECEIWDNIDTEWNALIQKAREAVK
jgi:hypothetical protein